MLRFLIISTFWAIVLNLSVTQAEEFAVSTNPVPAIYQTDQTVYISIRAHEIGSMEDIHNLISQALHFPKWYGKNLDALEELLADPAYAQKKKVDITIYGGGALAQKLGAEKMQSLLDVLNDCQEKNLDEYGLQRVSIMYWN